MARTQGPTWTTKDKPAAPVARDVTHTTTYRDVNVTVARYSYGSTSLHVYAWLGTRRLMVMDSSPSSKATDDELKAAALALVDGLLAAGFTAAAS